MHKKKGTILTEWQASAVRELRLVADALSGDFQLIGHPESTSFGFVCTRIRLCLADLPRTPHGLPLGNHEEFLLLIGPNRFSPPLVEVDHERFLGHPHVLHGQRLCIYLDPSREWDPKRGLTSAIDRLYDWLADAAAGRFDPESAMFHAVGGLLHRTEGTPTVVVRSAGRPVKVQHAFLVQRTPYRYDVHFQQSSPDQHRALVFEVAAPLPLGAGTQLGQLLSRLDDPLSRRNLFVPRSNPQAPAFITALAAVAARNAENTPQLFILAIPHPNGGPPHLLAGCIPTAAANGLRRLVRRRRGSVIDIKSEIFEKTPVEWCSVSDERVSVTRRRDAGRPTGAFEEKTVHIWGCGGLGSWIAEFVTRAGAKRLVLCDHGAITGGLLVRQNFTENDIGENKAEALQRRITAIRDDIEVEAHTNAVPDNLAALFPSADIVIDATISRAIGQFLDELARAKPRPLLAQVATDSGTSTLGILTVSDSANPKGPNTIDQEVGSMVTATGELESFHTFWKEVSTRDELIPTRGCSVPTFHGSAADLAAVAASLVSILGTHLACTEPISGTHLIGLPHSPAGPYRRFIPARLNTVP